MCACGKFFKGLILGGIVGSLLVLLFAPAPGTETREKLKGKYYYVRDEVKNAAEQKSEELKQELAKLQQKS